MYTSIHIATAGTALPRAALLVAAFYPFSLSTDSVNKTYIYISLSLYIYIYMYR